MATRDRSRSVSVTYHQPSRQYKKTIGKRRGRDGRSRPKVFYLGPDQREAKNKAVLLMAEWVRLQAAGAQGWPQSTTAVATDDPAAIISRKESETDRDGTRFVRPGELTVEDAARVYIGDQERRLAARQVSCAHVRHMRYRIGRVVEALGPVTLLCEVGKDELQRAVDFFIKRPRVRRREADGRPAAPMAIDTAVGFIRAMKSMFVWLDEDENIVWTSPKSFRRIFSVKREAMKTEEERRRDAEEMVSGRIPLFSIEDLRKLYAAADGRTRAWMLVALNCGFSQKDLSDLRTFEVLLDDELPAIHRRRGKTNVEMRWELWPETVEAMRREQSPPNHQNRVFLSAHGKTLCGGKEDGRDAVRQVWRYLRIEAGMKGGLGFKYLRKTGADTIKRLSGVEVSEMYLAHVEIQRMNRHYANRDWDRLTEVIRRAREIFEPVWRPQA